MSTLIPASLRREYLVNPLAVQSSAPRLSWELIASRPGLRGPDQPGKPAPASRGGGSRSAVRLGDWNPA